MGIGDQLEDLEDYSYQQFVSHGVHDVWNDEGVTPEPDDEFDAPTVSLVLAVCLGAIGSLHWGS